MIHALSEASSDNRSIKFPLSQLSLNTELCSIPPRHYMIQHTRDIESRLSRHEAIQAYVDYVGNVTFFF
jgi:hypothetical protein